MSGRDAIGIARTGSGKTLAFLLPLLRHCKAQRPLAMGEGPIALILAPTRELAGQIYSEAKRAVKGAGLRASNCAGGGVIQSQISDLKRGVELVVATPGRFIDLLRTNSGRVVNLRRVTYLVIDECDRMFDAGFEPQLQLVVKNIRPDAQRLVFSATFPHVVESLAKQMLTRPVEIVAGGRSVVCDDVTQRIEVCESGDRWLKLLGLLGEWTDKGSILVFVLKQDTVDDLFGRLTHAGYVCGTLHGGMEQADRESMLADFRSGAHTLLLATSVAARGIDVPAIKLVCTPTCPVLRVDCD